MTSRRHNPRKEISEVDVLNVKNVNSGEVYFSRASIVDVSSTGLLLFVKREHILAMGLRSNLSMAGVHNAGVGFTIEVMDTYIEGVVTRTKSEGRGDFLVAVDFREDAPEYWRNCLVDLLPEGPHDYHSDEESDSEGEDDLDPDSENDSEDDPEDEPDSEVTE